MKNYAIIKDGWVDGIVSTECKFNSKKYPKHVELTKEEFRKITESQLTMFHDGEKFCQIKDPKVIWKRLVNAGLRGTRCVMEHKKHLQHRDITYSDIPVTPIINTPEIKKTYEPLFETEFTPDLRISPAIEDDVEIWETEMIKSGLFTKGEAWGRAADWLSDPKTWCIKTVWKDKVLQIETYHFNNDGSISAGFTAHLDKGRSGWFWRQMAKPIFQALYAQGFESIKTSVRKDRRDWVDNLKELYGAKELRETEKGVILKYKIEDTLSLIGSWPTRRTMGIDWKWEKKGITLREATEEDLTFLDASIETSWGTNTRKELVKSRLEKMWELNQATIILALKDGKIINSRVYRERADPTVSFVFFPTRAIRTKDTGQDIDLETALEGFDLWQKGVGYTTSSFIIETSLWLPQATTWDAMGWKVHSQTEESTECRKGL